MTNELNIIDRFLYKFLICTLLLLGIVLLDKIKVLKIERLQVPLSEHLNILPALQLLDRNGILLPLEITDQVSSSTYQVYQNAEKITNGRLIVLDDFQGVENYKPGVVVRIHKDTDGTYAVTVKGIDGLEYRYNHLENVDVNIYKYLRSGDIIGLPATKDGKNFYRFYIYNRDQAVHLLP
jgi:hypothetical protein